MYKRQPIYNINEEGLFASRDYADGRLIPSIVISSKEDDYIKEIITLHSNISMGDVEVQWGGTLSSLVNADRWILNIRFYKPIDYNLSLIHISKNMSCSHYLKFARAKTKLPPFSVMPFRMIFSFSYPS